MVLSVAPHVWVQTPRHSDADGKKDMRSQDMMITPHGPSSCLVTLYEADCLYEESDGSDAVVSSRPRKISTTQTLDTNLGGTSAGSGCSLRIFSIRGKSSGPPDTTLDQESDDSDAFFLSCRRKISSGMTHNTSRASISTDSDFIQWHCSRASLSCTVWRLMASFRFNRPAVHPIFI